MCKKHLILIFYLLLFNCLILPQNNNSNIYKNSAKIISADIDLKGIVTRYKPGHTRIYPPSRVPYQARHYVLTFRIQTADDLVPLKKPLKIKCFLSNGKVIESDLQTEQGVYFPNEIYESIYETFTEENYYGRARVELVLYFPDIYYYKKDKEIVLDTKTIFIQ